MKSTMTTMVASLTVLTVVAAAALAGVRLLSEPKAEEARQEKLRQAVVAVLPPFSDLQTDDSQDRMTIYRTSNGTAVESYSDAGFGGTVCILFGFEPDGTLHGYKVLSHNETPGLGAKMDGWFDAAGTSHNVLGTRGEQAVTKDGGQIDAITGATITSRAFLEALNRARRTAFPQQ